MWGVDRGWMPLPTRPRRYCNPVLLVVSSYSKYQSFRFICHPNKNSPVFPSRQHPLYIEMDGTSMASLSRVLQYDGSKDDLDWRIDFRYLNLI